MLTMSHNASVEHGSWKESFHRSSNDSVESSSSSSDDSDNSSSSTNSSLNGGGGNSRPNNNNNSNSNSHLQQPPIGCITTHRVSAVIRPEIKIPPIDPLQFVKIQKNELSKTAVEQIKLAEEEKITKEKIKEVEEEWQNNLMSWKSKRKLTKNHSEDETLPRNPNRKTKTFSEILMEKAKSGARIGYNLHKYVDPDLENVDNVDNNLNNNNNSHQTTEFLLMAKDEMAKRNDNNVSRPNMDSSSSSSEQQQQLNMKTNLDRFMELDDNENSMNDKQITRNGLGEIVVFNTSLLEEFSVKSEQQQQHCDKKQQPNNDDNSSKEIQKVLLTNSKNESSSSSAIRRLDKKVHVPINDWKSSHQQVQQSQQQQQQLTRKSSSSNEDDISNIQQQQNSSFENDDDEELLDEELEKLRIDQERSFKAKLHTFEILAKQEEEAARRAAEANIRRQKNRLAKLAAERSKSLSNINSQPKHPLVDSSSVSSSSLQNKISKVNNNDKSANKSIQNVKPVNNKNNDNNNNEDNYYLTCKNQPTNSVVYNFKEKQIEPQPPSSKNTSAATIEQSRISPTKGQTIGQKSSSMQPVKIQTIKTSQQVMVKNNKLPGTQESIEQSSMNNIYENVPSITTNHHQHPNSIQQSNNNTATTSNVHQQQPATTLIQSSNDIIGDPDTIRNASQKLLQQQQQIYQNQPPPPTTITTNSIKHPSMIAPYPNDHYSNISSLHGKTGSYLHHHHTISDDVGLPPIQITKSIQTSMPPTTSTDDSPHLHSHHHQTHPVYQNQMITNSQQFHNYENSPETMILPARDDLVSCYYPPPITEPNFHNHHPQTPNYPQSNLSMNVNSQYLYYPKPYVVGSNGNTQQILKPNVVVSKQQQSTMPNNVTTRVPPPSSTANRYGANGYNPNHWVIQEAELRQSTQRMQQQQQAAAAGISSNSKNCPGYLSVSGKKKCSKCGDELGKGCAAMVVESLSLYYHINCFRCSVCNIQLGNGTVGTDVRVRNNKLHCQNCYSNDEAGLKFSRV
ncbi:LIM domain only protein 7 [Dermatophagoides pteronyssinus]|uniref:LIM domain only protein 7 n=1 Tax=Dermatophagoides pteronyssinus TaxID=6956 RepID=A0ABQ8JTI2_DERPT|nr:LIM domain only protein 7 [Dermatophagoides pteronyssinus]